MNRVPSLSIDDLKCSCCGKNGTTEEWYDKMEVLFWLMGWDKNRISSSYRCYEHDKKIGGGGVNHPGGFATDVYVKPGDELKQFIKQCLGMDVRRMFLYPKRGFVHIDDNFKKPESINFG